MTENRTGEGASVELVAAGQSEGAATGIEILFVNAVILLSFFPFFRYIPGLEIESQPVAAIVALIGMGLLGVSSAPVVRAALSVIAVILGLSVYAVGGLGVPKDQVVAQAIAYTAPVFVFAFLWERTALISWRLVITSASAYLLVGLMQFAGAVPGFLDATLTGLISRYQSAMVGGGRGVVMLAPEPDYASRQLLLCCALTVYMRLIGRISRRAELATLIVVGLAMIILNRSITGIGLYALFVMLLALARVRLKRIMIVAISLAIATPLAVQQATKIDVSSVTQDSSRLVQLGAKMLQEAAKGTFGFQDVVQFASARLVTNVAGARAIPENLWVGVGIGEAEDAVFKTLQNDSFFQGLVFRSELYGNLKPQPWLTCFVLETGMLGAAALLLFLLLLARSATFAARDHAKRAFVIACLAVATMQMLFLGPHSLPEPWILYALIGFHRISKISG